MTGVGLAACALLALMLWSGAANAQGSATLVADSIALSDGDTLVATGNVEIFYDGTRLTASRVTYDQSADRLDIDGPILVTTGPDTTLLADRAQIEPTLANGVLRGARLVLSQQLQLAANRIDRVDGRYSQLSRVAATSCRVCARRAPLWSIRAGRVIHDEAARQLYFENAQFLIRDVPVFWLPRMRLPDPTLDRATGLLVPRIRTTSQLRTGLKLPYFFTLGPSRDLTLTPYLSPETRTLEFRYRQAFRNGEVAIEGGISGDTIRPDDRRGTAAITGRFELPADFTLDFEGRAVSDDGYLSDYGISDTDRLDNRIAVTRTDRDLYLGAALLNLQYLRDDTAFEDEPSLIGDVSVRRRRLPGAFGGEVTLGLDGRTLTRFGNQRGDEGRDLQRLTFGADWRRDWTLPAGLLVETTTGLAADYYAFNDDTSLPGDLERITPSASATLRWPLSRTGGGAVHLLEPVAHLAWSDFDAKGVPNEDSTRPEFDEANLFAPNRYPGGDLQSDGLRSALGLVWTRLDAAGWSSSLAVGRVYRQDADPGFSRSSGLQGSASDWLVSGQIDLAGGLHLASRSLIDDAFDIAKSETRLDWRAGPVDLAASHVWLIADDSVNRGVAVSEWAIDAAYEIGPRWQVSGDIRYDIRADQPVAAGVGARWRNECVVVDLSVSRSYTSSDNVEESTDIGLSLGLRGFSAGRAASTRSAAGACRS